MKKYCLVTLLFIFTVYFSLFSQELLFKQISLLNFENRVTDVFINNDNFGVALLGKLIIYDDKGKKTNEIDGLQKYHNREISFCETWISATSGKNCKYLEIYKNGQLYIEILCPC